MSYTVDNQCYNISIPGDESQLVASPSEWKPRGPSRGASRFLGMPGAAIGYPEL
jgi:hypothetical protein